MKKIVIILILIILLAFGISISQNKPYTIQNFYKAYDGLESQEIDEVAPKIEVSYSETQKTKEDVVVTITADEEISKIVSGDNFFDDNITYTSNYYEAANGIIPYGLIKPNTAANKETLIPLIVWLHGDGEVEADRNNIYGDI